MRGTSREHPQGLGFPMAGGRAGGLCADPSLPLRLPYNEFFGGVSGLTVEQFQKINGFPNAFWGWGGEDDDLWNRVQYAGYSVTRPEGDTGKYKSIPHHHRGEVQFLGRYALLRKSKERQALDGLNNLNYFPNVTYDALYKNITVNLTPELALVTEY